SHCLPKGLVNFVLHMYKHLTREQRYAIYLGLQKHETNKAIAQAIKVSLNPSEGILQTLFLILHLLVDSIRIIFALAIGKIDGADLVIFA
ncbi:MAG: helix-turn-helix domain-containing protein, partial [Bacteroidales bacterium]|nr:helix-turn-helix domain-containing protein [Bacteroidales bacterium]MDY2705914.1 helix-turn-helix domain-containing protein [Alloprevotella sp.]